MPIRILLLAASLLLGLGTAQASEATFSTRTLTPEAALTAAQAALKSCRDSGFQVAIAITDRTGTPIVMVRDRFAGAHTPETAIRKAYTAASFRMDTVTLATATEAGQPASGIRQVGQVLALGGGLPIEAAGALVGAIGVSGAPGGEADRACSQAGIDAIADDLEF